MTDFAGNDSLGDVNVPAEALGAQPRSLEHFSIGKDLSEGDDCRIRHLKKPPPMQPCRQRSTSTPMIVQVCDEISRGSTECSPCMCG